MAWRIDEQVIRGEIDNRVRGRVTGRIWLARRDEPIVLDLKGNAWRDLAGHVLRFTNPEPQPAHGSLEGLADRQNGVVGDITASRKVKVPECSREELEELYVARKPFPWRWGNALYLEWFSERNGRIVIESASYELDLDATEAWEMSEEEETEQRRVNAGALADFMDRLVTAIDGDAVLRDEDDDDDLPRSHAEKEADAEAARMDLLLDRVSARLDRDPDGEKNFDRILTEERERLRRERGEPEEPPPTPEQEAEHAAWIEEMNAVAEEALAEAEAEKWKRATPKRRPPLVARCSDLSVRLVREVDKGGWLPEDAQGEHPLVEIVSSTQAAAAKLAGALGMDSDREWPPRALFAGNALVRLKKARDYLRDALLGLDSADEENLASTGWRIEIRREIGEILGAVQEHIHEVRQVLENDEDS